MTLVQFAWKMEIHFHTFGRTRLTARKRGFINFLELLFQRIDIDPNIWKPVAQIKFVLTYDTYFTILYNNVVIQKPSNRTLPPPQRISKKKEKKAHVPSSVIQRVERQSVQQLE